MYSANPGDGFIGSIVGVAVASRIVYNYGYYVHSYVNSTDPVVSALPVSQRIAAGQKTAYERFKETAAHEFGHSVLQDYHGSIYSYQHHGTSNYWQETLTTAAQTPAAGEIDLMKYYDSIRVKDYYGRVTASENDVEALIWLSRLDLNPPRAKESEARARSPR